MLWREQHPDALVQLRLNFTVPIAPALPVPLDFEDVATSNRGNAAPGKGETVTLSHPFKHRLEGFCPQPPLVA